MIHSSAWLVILVSQYSGNICKHQTVSLWPCWLSVSSELSHPAHRARHGEKVFQPGNNQITIIRLGIIESIIKFRISKCSSLQLLNPLYGSCYKLLVRSRNILIEGTFYLSCCTVHRERLEANRKYFVLLPSTLLSPTWCNLHDLFWESESQTCKIYGIFQQEVEITAHNVPTPAAPQNA